MIVKERHHRARIIKGWAFMNLPDDVNEACHKFMETGNTEDLPDRFKRDDYSIYLTKH